MLSELLQETVNFYKKFAFEINVIRLEVSLSFFFDSDIPRLYCVG